MESSEIVYANSLRERADAHRNYTGASAVLRICMRDEVLRFPSILLPVMMDLPCMIWFLIIISITRQTVRKTGTAVTTTTVGIAEKKEKRCTDVIVGR